jgi:hypothetical protein
MDREWRKSAEDVDETSIFLILLLTCTLTTPGYIEGNEKRDTFNIIHTF